MEILVVLAHPDERSLNAALADAAVGTLRGLGHTVVFCDLYRERFDPLLFADEFGRDAAMPAPIRRHCDAAARADGIVIVHPNWWGQPPAILKGWVDRVLRPGVAYRFEDGDNGEGVPVGLLKAQSAVVLNTANTSRLREETLFGDPLERIWKDCIFDLCGVKQFYRKMFRIVVTSSPEQRAAWLEDVREMMRQHFPAKEHA